jgi:hypothetical protein
LLFSDGTGGGFHCVFSRPRSSARTLGFELGPADFIFGGMNNAPILQLDLPGIKKVRSG